MESVRNYTDLTRVTSVDIANLCDDVNMESKLSELAGAISYTKFSDEEEAGRENEQEKDEAQLVPACRTAEPAVNNEIPEIDTILGLRDRVHLRPIYVEALEAVLKGNSQWPICYRNRQMQCIVRQLYTPENKTVRFHVLQVLDAPISDCMAQANEFDLWPKWHLICSKNTPLGPDDDKFYRISYWKKNFAMGLVKGEVLCEINRFVNQKQGFYVEQVRNLPDTSPEYFPAEKGIDRDDTYTSFMLVPLSKNKTLVNTVIRSAIPKKLPDFIVRRILAPLGGQFCHTYAKVVDSITHPIKGVPWRDRIKQDSSGIYALLDSIGPLDERHSNFGKGAYLNEELQRLLQVGLALRR